MQGPETQGKNKKQFKFQRKKLLNTTILPHLESTT